MLKKYITILITLSIFAVTCAQASFIACPSKLKISHDGQIIKTKSGTWVATVDSGHDIYIPFSIPGLMREKNTHAYKMVCYDDSKSPFPKYIQNGKPIYNVYFIYKNSCKKPMVDKEKNGFHCN